MSTAIYMSGGSLEAALEHSSRALAGYDRKAHSKQRFQYTYEPRCAALAGQSLQLTLRGYFEQAKAAERDGVDHAAQFGHPQTTAHQLAYKLLRGEFQQDYSEQDETAAALAQHTSEYKIVFWSLWTNIFRGFAAARNGRPLEGVEMIDNSLQIFAEMQFTYYRPYHLGLRARAYELAGDIESALASASEAIAVARQSGETVVLADLLRICGELRLAESDGSAAALAENLFNEAIGLAQAQASKLHELRAATSLARLWGKQGRSADGKKLLQPVYDWFTEGLDAPDLVGARTVLGGVAADLQQREDA
jgi:adenylate cyclase